MNEMKIKLFMDEHNNITITNLTTTANFVISYIDKTITAPSIYELLNYQQNCTYEIESNITDIIKEKEKTYFSDIIALFKDITKEISDMAESIDDEAEKVMEENINNAVE